MSHLGVYSKTNYDAITMLVNATAKKSLRITKTMKVIFTFARYCGFKVHTRSDLKALKASLTKKRNHIF